MRTKSTVQPRSRRLFWKPFHCQRPLKLWSITLVSRNLGDQFTTDKASLLMMSLKSFGCSQSPFFENSYGLQSNCINRQLVLLTEVASSMEQLSVNVLVPGKYDHRLKTVIEGSCMNGTDRVQSYTTFCFVAKTPSWLTAATVPSLLLLLSV